MIFPLLGEWIAKRWALFLVGWLFLLFAGSMAAVPWDEVTEQGELPYLPAHSPSRIAEEQFHRAFPKDLLASSVVIVVRRLNRAEGLTTVKDVTDPRNSDFDFIEHVLKPRLEQIAEEQGGFAESDGPEEDRSSIVRVRTHTDSGFEKLLLSEDNKAALIIVELSTEFFDPGNQPTIEAIEALLIDLRREGRIPAGLDLSLSGAATVGRDLMLAEQDSIHSSDVWSLILVIGLLVVTYRSPGQVVVPLVTVLCAILLSHFLVTRGANWGFFTPFSGVEIYVRVLLTATVGSSCLVLMARYREQLDTGESSEEGIARTLGSVGAVLTATAVAVILSLGLMTFAVFGKFREAGQIVSFSLMIGWLAALTLPLALLRMSGRFAFWPQVRYADSSRGWISRSSAMSGWLQQISLREAWEKLSQRLRQFPGRYWLCCVVPLVPFAVLGLFHHEDLNYGLLSELPADYASVQGAKAVQEHFPAGTAGPVTVLLYHPEIDFREIDGTSLIESLTRKIRSEETDLGVVNVRSISHPLGGEESLSQMSLLRRKAVWLPAVGHYVSESGTLAGHITRLDVIFEKDPFSEDSLRDFRLLEERLRLLVSSTMPPLILPAVQLRELGVDLNSETSPVKLQVEGNIALVQVQNPAKHQPLVEQIVVAFEKLPALARVEVGVAENDVQQIRLIPEEDYVISSAREGNTVVRELPEIYFMGATASMRDLKQVVDADQRRIQILSTLGLLLVLLLHLRQPMLSLYLLLSVLLTYTVSLGATYCTFWWLFGGEFTELDWKVPIYLFTVLVAVGQQPLLLLLSRIEEERLTHGPVDSVTIALEKTGGILSSCGLLMAATFCSLMAGTLVGLHQLGFALALGVLLNTFVVRPILLPSFLIMLYTGRFGRLGISVGTKTPVASRAENL